MIGPCLHVGSGVAQPLGDVELLAAGSCVLAFVELIVAHVEVEAAVVYHRCRIGCELVCYQRISCRSELLAACAGYGCGGHNRK